MKKRKGYCLSIEDLDFIFYGHLQFSRTFHFGQNIILLLYQLSTRFTRIAFQSTKGQLTAVESLGSFVAYLGLAQFMSALDLSSDLANITLATYPLQNTAVV